MKPLVQCKHCGWIHFAVTRAYAEDEVKRFNEYYDSGPPEVQELFGRRSSIKNYEHCGLCGKLADMVKPTKELIGSTIGPIIFEKEIE